MGAPRILSLSQQDAEAQVRACRDQVDILRRRAAQIVAVAEADLGAAIRQADEINVPRSRIAAAAGISRQQLYSVHRLSARPKTCQCARPDVAAGWCWRCRRPVA